MFSMNCSKDETQWDEFPGFAHSVQAGCSPELTYILMYHKDKYSCPFKTPYLKYHYRIVAKSKENFWKRGGGSFGVKESKVWKKSHQRCTRLYLLLLQCLHEWNQTPLWWLCHLGGGLCHLVSSTISPSPKKPGYALNILSYTKGKAKKHSGALRLLQTTCPTVVSKNKINRKEQLWRPCLVRAHWLDRITSWALLVS